MNNLGDFLKSERLKKGMSLRTFAEKCGISHTHLDSLEKGRDFRTGKQVSITIETLIKIADCLNVKPEFLMQLISTKEYDINLEVLSNEEKTLIENYRKCNEENKNRLLNVSENIAEK